MNENDWRLSFDHAADDVCGIITEERMRAAFKAAWTTGTEPRYMSLEPGGMIHWLACCDFNYGLASKIHKLVHARPFTW